MYNPKESKIVSVVGKTECDLLAFSLNAMCQEYDSIKDDIYICRTIILGSVERSDDSYMKYFKNVDKYSKTVWVLEKQKDFGRKRCIRYVPYLTEDSHARRKGFEKFKYTVEDSINCMEEYDSNEYSHPYKVIDILLNLPYIISKNNKKDQGDDLNKKIQFTRDVSDFMIFIKELMNKYKDKYIINLYMINNIISKYNNSASAIINRCLYKDESVRYGVVPLYYSDYIFRMDKMISNDDKYIVSIIKSRYDENQFTSLYNTINLDEYIFEKDVDLRKNTKSNN